MPFLAAGFDNAEKLWQAQKPILEEVLAEEDLMVLFSKVWPGQGLYAQEPVETSGGYGGACPSAPITRPRRVWPN